MHRENRGIKPSTLVSWQHSREGRCRLLCCTARDVASFPKELRFYFGTVVACDVSYRFSIKKRPVSLCMHCNMDLLSLYISGGF